ncbi:MAG TPA: DUF4124 domain-containing protein [Gammaproteobacteria bacterium]
MNYAEPMRILLLIIYFCLSLPILAKDVYRTVDDQGNVVFSDTPVEGAEKIRVDEIQTIAPDEVPKFVYTPPPEVVETYSKLEIVSPENDSVIQSDEGNVTVSAVLEPALNLRAGHYLVLYLDGNEAASGTSPQFILSNIERGTHILDIAVVDQSGNQVINSPTVSFTRYQHSVLHK